MFENVIGQSIIKRLVDDIEKRQLPPSLLFFGPNSAGKFSSALELARSVSCLENAAWDCNCESCKKHKEMLSPDLLVVGAGEHILEITAASEALLKNKTISSRYLFLRAVRKLTIKFDSRLWDTDEQKFLKAAPIISEIEELLGELVFTEIEIFDDIKLKKLVNSLVTKSTKLFDECAYDAIPINQVRKISSWIRLMPTGSKKIIIIQNADKMQDGARNAFLKILEEPPAYSIFILTTERKGAIIPTILSRVRAYKFNERSDEKMEEVIRRVFKGDILTRNKFGNFSLLKNFLYSFLPVDFYTIQKNAVLFYYLIFNLLEIQNKTLPNALYSSVNKFKQENNIGIQNISISAILNELHKCKSRGIFVLFLNSLLFFLHIALKENNNEILSGLETEKYFRATNLIRKAEAANGIFNISVQSILENLVVSIAEVF